MENLFRSNDEADKKEVSDRDRCMADGMEMWDHLSKMKDLEGTLVTSVDMMFGAAAPSSPGGSHFHAQSPMRQSEYGMRILHSGDFGSQNDNIGFENMSPYPAHSTNGRTPNRNHKRSGKILRDQYAHSPERVQEADNQFGRSAQTHHRSDYVLDGSDRENISPPGEFDATGSNQVDSQVSVLSELEGDGTSANFPLDDVMADSPSRESGLFKAYDRTEIHKDLSRISGEDSSDHEHPEAGEAGANS